ncbi:hypothetical protein [Streptomyces sp. NPDC047046]|uniref:hypothetical protein n=1 Tax=Streptomyces sp. NPDC047046 TaxID=3155378 RepID=UPI0033DA2741
MAGEAEHPSGVEQRFRSGTERRIAWGIGLLIAAGLCWIWSAWHTFTPYDSEVENGVRCAAPFHRDEEGHYGSRDRDDWDSLVVGCAVTRDWQSTTVPLVISFPIAVTGAGLLAGALATRRMLGFQADVERAQREWARTKGDRT